MDKTIFLIEGDYGSRAMTGQTLMRESYLVVNFMDLKDIEFHLSEGTFPDLVIAGVEGQDPAFIRKLRKLPGCERVPVLLLVEEKMLCRQLEWKEAGATSWVVKPFGADELLRMVRMMSF